MNIELTSDELQIMGNAVRKQLTADIEFYANADAVEFVPVAQEIAVLSKVRQVLDDELGTDEDSHATNDTVLSDWN